MKLRNKKTGEIINGGDGFKLVDYYEDYGGGIKSEYVYNSLAELNEDWEDYATPEPLIKDEKMRKAVRVWSEANDVAKVFIDRIGDGSFMVLYDEDDGRRRISVRISTELDISGAYTIEELVGRKNR